MKKLIKVASLTTLALALTACKSSSDDDRSDIDLDPKVVPVSRAIVGTNYLLDNPYQQNIVNQFGASQIEVYYRNNDRETYDEPLVGSSEWMTEYEWSFEETFIKPIVDQVRANDGQFYKGWDESYILLVDVKSSNDEKAITWLEIEKVLSKYRDVFTHYDGQMVTEKAVTVVLSGSDHIIDEMRAAPYRFAFLDGRMNHLGEEIESTLMPMISSNFNYFDRDEYGNFYGAGDWPQEALHRLQEITDIAAQNNQKIRFWSSPEGNDEINAKIWTELLNANVDLIVTRYSEELRTWLLDNEQEPSQASVVWTDHPLWTKAD
ncbi:hypothetical protein [uncultured Vibrio sp.]|uniref:hypothetical protein n=1 Tax=uncultured Vibrio sp. TaxID=114054 RepID=UPI0025FB127A|nr:hypothetical protein [uncultured Vibrio sp.]